MFFALRLLPDLCIEDTPEVQASEKLKPLIEDLFEKIMPHGISQLVQVPTHAHHGVAIKCLDHLYSTNPEKLSNIEAEFTGMSDHKLVKVQRFSKTLKQCPRYVRKRCFKNFDKGLGWENARVNINN